jgi:hypothetical protein
VVAPLNAPGALGGTGPGGSTPDLAVATVDHNLLTNEVACVAARDGIHDVNPRDTSVGVGGSAHEARCVFDERVEQRANRGRALSKLPGLGLGWDVRHVDDLQEGRRRDESGLDGHDARDGDEAADVFENTRRLRSVRVSKQSNSAEDGLREISRSVDQMVT